jgi:hypothetical protein
MRSRVLRSRAERKLSKAVPGSAERERHEGGQQGAYAVHEQVAYRVGQGELAYEEPLEDLPVGADRDAQGEHTEVASATALCPGTAPA